jgi:hypothetical protein
MCYGCSQFIALPRFDHDHRLTNGLTKAYRDPAKRSKIAHPDARNQSLCGIQGSSPSNVSKQK